MFERSESMQSQIEIEFFDFILESRFETMVFEKRELKAFVRNLCQSCTNCCQRNVLSR